MLIKKEHLEELRDSVKTNILELNNQLLEHKQELQKNNQESFNMLLEKIQQLENKQNTFGDSFDDELYKINELSQQFESRINGFKLLEHRANKHLFEEVSLQIKSQIETLFNTTKKYQELESKMVKVQESISTLNEEISKFSNIAKEIKTADFQLSKFAKQVTSENQEKLSLMRENERLKLLISKERRNNRY